MNKNKIKNLFLVFTMAFLIACTSTAPITGRHQLKLVDDAAIVNSSVASYNQLINQTKSQGLLANNTADGRRLATIGRKMAKAVETYMIQNGMEDRVKYLSWEFNLIKSKEINAFAMPGGKIAFYTGILPILKNDAGIAFVMGHEIGHVIAGHHAEGASNRQVAGIAAGLTNILVGGPASALISDGLSLGLLKFNRTQEYEADKYGLIFMAMAGYNPEEGVKAEERMAAISKSSGSDFTSTHPASAKRIQALKEFLPEAMKYYKK